MSGHDDRAQDDALLREVVALRAQVAELHRAAARHEDTGGITVAEREELLREAERMAHFGTWSWDIQGGRVSWSNEMYRILGFEPGITPSVEAFFAAVHPEDRARAMATAEQAQADGVLPLVDCRIVRPDGSIRHTTTCGSYLFDAQGQARRMVGGVLDRTEALDAELVLRRTLALLEEAQSSAQLGSWRYEPATEALEWSAEFRRIAGLPPHTTPRVEDFLACVMPEDRKLFQRRHLETLQEPAEGMIDGRIQRASGEIRHVRVKGIVAPSENGRVELRGTMLDITDQVRLREELVQAQKMEAVGRLAGGIAHDFNNLLTIVSGNIELFTEQFGRTVELDDCSQALESAANLTRRLLAFGRKAQLSLRVVDPNQLVESTVHLMQRLVGDQIGLRTKLTPNLPRINVDPVEIERALVNLVVNAKNAMPQGGLITLSTQATRGEGPSWVEISVTDEGVGVSEVDRPHIFEPFYTTRLSSGGTGLGLATVLGTAEQHGGTVRVEGKEGSGSTFVIVLPESRSASRPATPEHGLPNRKDEPETRVPRTLLIVDDEFKVAEVTRRMLLAQGHSVYMACTHQEAEIIWRQHGAAVDLLICDVVMPELGGPELVRYLATLGTEPRVLFISGYNEEATHAELGHPFLAKPFTAVSLAQAIEQALAE